VSVPTPEVKKELLEASLTKMPCICSESNPNVAPALEKAKARLEGENRKNQLADSLQQRPNIEELQKRNILPSMCMQQFRFVIGCCR
jgi:hypothetical protein